jgi:hypothetical protein
MGVDKSDLLEQYISYPTGACGSAGGFGGICALTCDDGTTGHPTVSHQAQADAAMDDAAAHGMQYLRVFGLGFYVEDMHLWWPGCAGTNPPCAPGTSWCTSAYWNKYDAMMQHAAAEQVHLSNGTTTTGLKLVLMPAGVHQFPFLAAGQDLIPPPVGVQSDGVAIASMVNATRTCADLLASYPNPVPGNAGTLPPDSTADPMHRGQTAKLLLCRHVRDVVTRYTAGGAHPEYATTIQMWELPQELYLYANNDYDQDPQHLPDMTVEQIAWFMRDLATSIKGWDPNHLIDTGDSGPRPEAAHSRARTGSGALSSYPYDLDDRNMMTSWVGSSARIPSMS